MRRAHVIGPASLFFFPHVDGSYRSYPLLSIGTICVCAMIEDGAARAPVDNPFKSGSGRHAGLGVVHQIVQSACSGEGNDVEHDVSVVPAAHRTPKSSPRASPKATRRGGSRPSSRKGGKGPEGGDDKGHNSGLASDKGFNATGLDGGGSTPVHGAHNENMDSHAPFSTGSQQQHRTQQQVLEVLRSSTKGASKEDNTVTYGYTPTELVEQLVIARKSWMQRRVRRIWDTRCVPLLLRMATSQQRDGLTTSVTT